MSGKLTLERWAALDAAASPGPWVVRYAVEVSRDHERDIYLLQTDQGSIHFDSEEDAALCAASKGAPTRLLAALRSKADEWASRAQEQGTECMDALADLDLERAGRAAGRAQAFGEATVDLRALLRDLDLSAQGEASDA